MLLDDGIVRSTVVHISGSDVDCEVKSCPPGFRLKAEKGINLPDSVFPAQVCALTEEDLVNLGHVLQMSKVRKFKVKNKKI